MVEVKAYEKWVTKVMSCVSVGLFPNSVGSVYFELGYFIIIEKVSFLEKVVKRKHT